MQLRSGAAIGPPALIKGGRRAAAPYTLVATANLNDIDPQAWLADILARVLDYPAKRIGDLLPWNWHAERHAAAA